MRRLFNAQKAGHAGTLDPLATGILPIALGEATKTVPFLMDADKAYRFTIAWGRTTATFDREGETDRPLRRAPDARPRSRRCLPRLRRRDQPGAAHLSRPSRSTASAPTTWPARATTVELKARTGDRIHSTPAWSRPPDADHIDASRSSAARAPMSAPSSATWPRRWAPAATSASCAARASGRFTRGFGDSAGIRWRIWAHEARRSEALLPVETALDDIPALAVTDEDAFRLKQGRADRSRSPTGRSASKAALVAGGLANRFSHGGRSGGGALRDARGPARTRRGSSISI